MEELEKVVPAHGRHDDEKDSCMDAVSTCLACAGDNSLPFIVGGVVLVALIVLVAAFVFMRRK